MGRKCICYGVWGGDPEVKATGGVGDSTIDIFVGPFPTGVAGTTNIGTFVPESELTETGVAGTFAIGTLGLDNIVNATGVQATGGVGAEEAQVNPGFGEGAWNDGTWGN